LSSVGKLFLRFLLIALVESLEVSGIRLLDAVLQDIELSEIRHGIDRAETRDMKDYPRRISGTVAKFCFLATLTYTTKPVVSVKNT
jgi:hypothetical protein